MSARPHGPSFFDASCVLPTEFGNFDMHVLRDGSMGKEAVVLSRGSHAGKRGVLLRVHDMCMTSEVFHSSKCDCRQQLREAQRRLSQHPAGGVIIYLQQEGRGIGIVDKIRAYQLQDEKGADTVDANRMLGLPDDARTYDCVPHVLRALSIRSVTLMTNNPRKVEHLRGLGVDIDGCAAAGVGAETLHERAASYVATKRRRMRHFDLGRLGDAGAGAGAGAGARVAAGAAGGPAANALRGGAGAGAGAGAEAGSGYGWADGRVLRVCDIVQERVRARTGRRLARRRKTQRVRANAGPGPGPGAGAASGDGVSEDGSGNDRVVVTLAYAQSLDGAIASRPRQAQATARAAEEEPRLVLSGPESNGLTHALRAAHDAVVVGIRTALSDDPLLTVRYDASGAPLAAENVPPPPQQPAGIVLDGALRTPPMSRLVQSAADGRRVIVVTTREGLDGAAGEEAKAAGTGKQLRARRLREAGVEVVVMPSHGQGQGQGQGLSATQIVQTLGARCGLRSIMVEGGAAVIASFLAASVHARSAQASSSSAFCDTFSSPASAPTAPITAAVTTVSAAASDGGRESGSLSARPLVDFLVVTISPKAVVGSSGVRPAYRRRARSDSEPAADDNDAAAQVPLPPPLQLASANSFVLGDGDIIVFSDSSGSAHGSEQRATGTAPLQQRSNL